MARGSREFHLPLAAGSRAPSDSRSAVVVGGGLAGVAAATVLAERGVEVTLVERQSYLGGRAGAWSER
ncbi:MAG: FAD-dependent oxidoreductase, partial [Gemmatimonadales bacterium]